MYQKKGVVMWLQYALDKDDKLVSIDDVFRGRSEIRCPYCQGELTAKKGKIKVHHFAHVNDT
ncbi:MAG: competence protein CoiA family protein, partial [Waterburya sp.]